MTKKHFIAIAEILGNVAYHTEEPSQLDTLVCVVEDLSAYFKAENPNFDSTRFRKAVMDSKAKREFDLINGK